MLRRLVFLTFAAFLVAACNLSPNIDIPSATGGDPAGGITGPDNNQGQLDDPGAPNEGADLGETGMGGAHPDGCGTNLAGGAGAGLGGSPGAERTAAPDGLASDEICIIK